MEYTGLSKRGIELVPKEPNPLVVYMNEYAKDPFHADSNPKGIIDCGVAENDVVSDIVLEKLKEVHQKLTPLDLHYTGFQGNPDLVKAISSFFNRHFHVNTKPDNIIITAGTGTALNNLATVICDPGDGILLPSPFYGAYLLDMTLLPKTKIITVPTRYEDKFILSIDTLTKIYDEKASQGETIKALLITNPNNPTGVGHTLEELTQLVDWAKQRRVHLIVNEIYALSSFKRTHSTILTLLDTMKDDDFVSHYVHFTYGFAKDFSVSGFRLSFAYSLNEHVVAAMGQTLSFFTTSSRQTQACFTHILNDEQWMDYYTKELKERLVCASKLVKNKLDAEQIKYVEPEGGLFIVLDLRSYLKENTFEAEKALFEHLLLKYKIYINFGHSFGFTEPGFFRVIFSRVKPTMIEAVNRIAAGLKAY